MTTPPAQPAVPRHTGFQLDHVQVRRGDTDVLADVSMELPAGVVTAIAGPSGSGKSTLLRLLNRFIDPEVGTVSLDGVDLADLEVRALRRRVGLVAQRPVLLTNTPADEVRAGKPGLVDAEVADVLARVGLGDIDPQRPTEGLSGGETQRLALARALAVGPQVLLLDEPTSALDPAAAGTVDEVIRTLVGSGLTAIIVSHDLRRLHGIADRVVVLDHGRIVEEGRPGEIGYLSD